jgi:hypothetical protein
MKKENKKKQIKPHTLSPRLEVELSSNSVIPPADHNYTRVFHAVNPGDLVASMGAIKRYYEVTKRKVIVSQSTSTLAAYYPGAVHPTVDQNGNNVCCNVPMWEMLKPLIESQEYVHSFEQYAGQRIDIDFNVIRGKTNVNLPHGAIQTWVPFAWPDLVFDMSKPWIILNGECPKNIKDQVSGKIILNFTERYRNNTIDYYFLQNYAPDLIFAGTEKEHYLFCTKWGLNIPRLEVKDFLELAYAIKECRFILSNQSMCWNIAESIKAPRILEVCQYAQNCIHMIGENSFGFFYQVGVEYYFRRLFKETMRK